MARMSSNLKDAEGFGTLDEGWYPMHCYDMEGDNDGVSTTDAGGDMWTGHFEIDDGPMQGKNVNYHNIMLGGMSKKGKAINTGMPGGLCEFVNASKLPWECLGCGAKHNGGLLHGPTAEAAGLDKNKFYCPACKTQAAMDYDTKDFEARQVMGYVGVREDLKGRPQNRIERFLPVGHPDAVNRPQNDNRRTRR